jgi:hypothetical protein
MAMDLQQRPPQHGHRRHHTRHETEYGCVKFYGCTPLKRGRLPSSTVADRTTDQPETAGAEWGESMELNRTGRLGRFSVLHLPLVFDADRPDDAGSRR